MIITKFTWSCNFYCIQFSMLVCKWQILHASIDGTIINYPWYSYLQSIKWDIKFYMYIYSELMEWDSDIQRTTYMLTGMGSLPWSSLIVRSSTPDWRATFFPSLGSPAWKMLVISVAMFFRTSPLVSTSWANWRSLHESHDSHMIASQQQYIDIVLHDIDIVHVYVIYGYCSMAFFIWVKISPNWKLLIFTVVHTVQGKKIVTFPFRSVPWKRSASSSVCRSINCTPPMCFHSVSVPF